MRELRALEANGLVGISTGILLHLRDCISSLRTSFLLILWTFALRDIVRLLLWVVNQPRNIPTITEPIKPGSFQEPLAILFDQGLRVISRAH